MPEYLTVAQVAAILHVSNQTVWDRIKAGRLPAIKEGRRYLIKQRDVDDYLSRQPPPGGEAQA